MNLISSLRSWFSSPMDDRLSRYAERELSHSRLVSIRPRPSFELFRDARGEIQHVRIGTWRVIAASGTRRIAEVRPLDGCDRVAVRIELQKQGNIYPSCTLWELYDLKGFLLAMLQTSGERDHWMVTDFKSDRSVPRRHTPVVGSVLAKSAS